MTNNSNYSRWFSRVLGFSPSALITLPLLLLRLPPLLALGNTALLISGDSLFSLTHNSLEDDPISAAAVDWPTSATINKRNASTDQQQPHYLSGLSNLNAGPNQSGPTETDAQAYVDSSGLQMQQQQQQQQQQQPHNTASSSLPMTINQSVLEDLYLSYAELNNRNYTTEHIVYALFCALIIVLSLFGNVLVCRVCMQNMTKTNALIMSLAVSDLAMTIFNIPFNFFRMHDFSWPFGSTVCFVVNFVQYLVVYNSSYTMAIIAIQRYYSVCCCLPSGGGGGGGKKGDGKTLVGRIFHSSVKTHQSYGGRSLCSMKTIFITILVIWLVASVLAAFFTFASTVVAHHTLLTILYEQLMSGHTSTTTEAFPFSGSSATSPTNHSVTVLSDTEFEFAPSSPSASSAPSPLSTTAPVPDFSPLLRCTNPVPVAVVEFLDQHFSIKADFAKTLVVFVTQYFVPLSVSCWLYIHIGKTIYHQGRAFKANSSAQIQQKKKRRRIFMLFLVVAVFAICWLPIHLFHIVIDAGVLEFHYQFFMMVQLLATSSVVYNPFIYCWLNKSFRRAAFRVFGFCCAKKASETDSNHNNHNLLTSTCSSSNVTKLTRLEEPSVNLKRAESFVKLET